MNKDLNIRISRASYRLLSKLAKLEGRTIKGELDIIIEAYATIPEDN